MKNDYLPLGSIVNIKDSDDKIMIIGYHAKKDENDTRIYDYKGCIYPKGIIDMNKTLFFNDSEIINILFEGYKSDSM